MIFFSLFYRFDFHGSLKDHKIHFIVHDQFAKVNTFFKNFLLQKMTLHSSHNIKTVSEIYFFIYDNHWVSGPY